jgi:hypothetical protein
VEAKVRSRSSSLAQQISDASDGIALNRGGVAAGRAATSAGTTRWPPVARAR